MNKLLEEQVDLMHYFQWLGDPLVHPKIDSILNIPNIEAPSNYLRVDTNGIALDTELIDTFSKVLLMEHLFLLYFR